MFTQSLQYNDDVKKNFSLCVLKLNLIKLTLLVTIL